MMKVTHAVVILLLIFSSCQALVHHSPQVTVLVETVLQKHTGYKSISKPIVLKAHELMFDLFDPQKVYLLHDEVTPFVASSNSERFFCEFSLHSFESYLSIIEICQNAIERMRTIRRNLSTEALMNHVSVHLGDDYASSIDELHQRVAHVFSLMIQDRLPIDARDKIALFERARASAEEECCLREDEWLYRVQQKDQDVTAARWILKAFLRALDAYSSIMDQQEARLTREFLTKEGCGTGITVELRHDGWTITRILKGSPAFETGALKVNDVLVKMDGKQCLEMSEQEIDGLLYAAKGSLQLEVIRLRGSKSISVRTTIDRRKFNIQEGRVDWEVRKTCCGTIAIMRLHCLYRNGAGISSSNDLRKAFEECTQREKISGVILDLRDNGGGYIVEAVKVVGLFIKTGVVFMAQYTDGNSIVFRDTDKGELFAGPLVIVTSKVTASAAEIVAQSLKDYGRAIIVGDERTYGKGKIQTQNVTEDHKGGAAFRMTVGSFYTVGGSSPQGTGVRADIVVPSLWLNKKIRQDKSANLPDMEPLFHDTLKDVGIDSLPWYREQYLPFLEQKSECYRALIPILLQKSKSRLQHSPSWRLFLHEPPKNTDLNTWKKREKAAQLEEAIHVMQDLIEETKSAPAQKEAA